MSSDISNNMPVKKKSYNIYVPPFKQAQLTTQSRDNGRVQLQKLTWDALKKSLNGLINKVNIINLRNIISEIFQENLVRGRGLLCRSLMKSQEASPIFTPDYAASVSIINTKFPEIGLLLLKRLVLHFRRAFKLNDKSTCLNSIQFIAHLINQAVAHELLSLEILMLLLDQPSEDSVELAVRLTKEVGDTLQEFSPKGIESVFERLRGIFHEGEMSKRIQYIIE